MASQSENPKALIPIRDSRGGMFRPSALRRSQGSVSYPIPGAPLSAGRSREESQAVISRMLTRLFFQESGALYLVNALQGTMELAAVWGSHETEEQALALQIGQGLMENRILLGDKASIPVLAPACIRPAGQTCLCVPMHSGHGLIGLLYARFKGAHPYLKTSLQERIVDQKQRFAVAAAEALALSLAEFTAAR